MSAVSDGAALPLRWGVVTTVHAAPRAILDFVAWHLELGAHRIYVHLDDPTEEVAFPLLKAHPRVRPTRCSPAYWARLRGKRPDKHQVRQAANATRVYARTAGELDWLAHIDVDEFLLPEGNSVAGLLGALPAECHVARLRPVEALAPPEGAAPSALVRFKAFTTDLPTRHAQTARIYPEFGPLLNGGMLSHVAGKVFARPGHPEAEFRIHNLLVPGGDNPGQRELPALPLAHFHAGSWPEWRARLDFRLERGAYRAGLKPPRPQDLTSVTLHEALATLAATEGEPGLRRFHDEVCLDHGALRARLLDEGLLREAVLDLDGIRMRHFGDIATA